MHIIRLFRGFELDEDKARDTLRKHGLDFADATAVLEDEWALTMRDEYEFSKARRGSVVPVPPGKTRITIRLDNDLLAWFRRSVHRAGGGSYQTLINEALREHVERRPETLEQTLRRVLREELPKARRPRG